MPRHAIADLNDPRLASFRDLKRSNESRESGTFILEGERLLDRLLETDYSVVSVMTNERNADRIAAKLPEGVDHWVASGDLIERLVGFPFHQATLASAQRPAEFTLDDLLERIGPRSLLMVAPQVDNPENLGALLRLADVFGVDALILSPRSPDHLSRRVLRVSMGTALRRAVVRSLDLHATIDRLRHEAGFLAVAAVTDREAESSHEFARLRPDRVALFMGSEAHGLDSRWLRHCSRTITIRMRAGADSLNLAVAAGILLYQLTTDEPG